MIKIVYPQFAFRIKEEDNQTFIFDVIRKKWLVLTPEEWVRQNFIQYLLQTMGYPAKWMAIEKTIRLGELSKRCDIVVYQNNQPWLIVECKEMNVPLSEAVVQQIVQYNMVLQVPYLIITNGATTYGFDCLQKQSIGQLPQY